MALVLRLFGTHPDRPRSLPWLVHKEYQVFPGVKGQRVLLTINLHLVPGAWMGRAMPLLLFAFIVCSRVKFPFWVSKSYSSIKYKGILLMDIKCDVHKNDLFVYRHVSSSALFINETNFIINIKHCILHAWYNYSLSSDFSCPSHEIKLIHNIFAFYVMPHLTKQTKNSFSTTPYPDAFHLINYRLQKLFSFMFWQWM